MTIGAWTRWIFYIVGEVIQLNRSAAALSCIILRRMTRKDGPKIPRRESVGTILIVRLGGWFLAFLVQVSHLKSVGFLVLVGVDIAQVKWGLIWRWLGLCLIA
jgi:hypothetical protein